MKIKNKRTLITLLVLVIVGVIGFTLAYFSDKINVNNIFKTKPYGTSITEVFESPDNWTPGTTTEKSVVATNTGQVDEAVRISYTEKWVAADGTELSGWVDENGKLTSHESEDESDERAALINFDNESDWTKVGDYYYYNYKLAPTESTSSFIKSVTFNPIVQSSSDCPKTVTGGSQTITCTSTGKGYDEATYTLTFTIETVQYDQYKNAWGTEVSIASEKPKTAVQTLLSKANGVEITNYTDGDTKEMYTFEHEATEQTGVLTDYRYIGDSPNNYVKFNCVDNGENCETWRIVGVFSVDDGTGNKEQRIKIVRGELLSKNYQWNNKDGNASINEWNESSLANTLNGTYYNEQITESAKSMIGEAKFYLGGMKNDDDTNVSAEDFYVWERGTDVYSNSDYCISNPTDSECKTRTIEWIENVALLYVSDFFYVYAKGVDNICYDNLDSCGELVWLEEYGDLTKGWIYNSNIRDNNNPSGIWLLTPNANDSTAALYVDSEGISQVQLNTAAFGVRPVVYLTSDVRITGGDGSSSNPYILSKKNMITSCFFHELLTLLIIKHIIFI